MCQVFDDLAEKRVTEEKSICSPFDCKGKTDSRGNCGGC